MCKAKVFPWEVFYFTGLVVVVGRPSYRIVFRTIKGGSQVGSLIVSWVESSNHCILTSCFLVLVLLSLWVLELMVILITSLSSSKTEFVCVFYDVFGVGGFTGLIRWRVLTIFLWNFSHLIILDISINIVLAMSLAFQQTWFRWIRSQFAKVVAVLVKAAAVLPWLERM